MAERQTRIIDVDDVAWGDGSSKMTLPEGVRVKLFAEDEATGRTDMLINFPVGYVEPRHTHDSWHSCFLKEGHWLVEGERLGPGSYMHGPAGPGQAHGPFHSPEGTYVFVSVGGDGGAAAPRVGSRGGAVDAGAGGAGTGEQDAGDRGGRPCRGRTGRS